MRTIVIKSENKELNEALEKLAEMFSRESGIEEEPESKKDKFVSLSAYEELEEMLDDTIEERDELKREN